jgi:hypothetical protein
VYVPNDGEDEAKAITTTSSTFGTSRRRQRSRLVVRIAMVMKMGACYRTRSLCEVTPPSAASKTSPATTDIIITSTYFLQYLPRGRPACLFAGK